ncbi:MAG: sulfite oxidase [Thermomicrobiales bacterium]
MSGSHDQRAAHPDGAKLTRRQLIAKLAAAGFSAPVIASIVASEALAQEATPAATPELAAEPGADLREALGLNPQMIMYDPFNYGTPLKLVDGLTVPNDLFFIRNNGPVPAIDPARWRLRVTGLVARELELSLADLQGMTRRTFTAFLECSGNSRGFFQPNASGTQWGNTAIGNAEWVGVPLADILSMAGVQEGAVDVVSRGGDFAEMQRGLPLGIAMAPDTMVVWQMNGEDLPAVHGGPVRLFVPGWGGIASTKWLVGIEVIDRPFDGSFNTESYIITTEHDQIVRPVREMPVKSVISTPTGGARLPAGQQTIAGYAWSGYAGITKVEISTNGGTEWADARITMEAGRLSWVRFEYAWDAQPGIAAILSRATDAVALTQPSTVPWNAKGYQYNAIFEVPVTVE